MLEVRSIKLKSFFQLSAESANKTVAIHRSPILSQKIENNQSHNPAPNQNPSHEGVTIEEKIAEAKKIDLASVLKSGQ